MISVRSSVVAMACCAWALAPLLAQDEAQGGDMPAIKAADDTGTLFVFEFETPDPARDERLRELMARIDAKLRRRLQTRALERVFVVVSSDASAFHARLARDGVVDVPEGTAGLALPGRDRCYINREALASDREGDFERVIGHEIAHLYLGRIDPQDRLPLWFHEGVAEWASRGARGGQFENLRVAAALDALDDLAELAEAFPEDRNRRLLAYEQSEAFVTYLDDYAMPGLPALLAWIEQGHDLATACERLLGRSLSTLEADWRRALAEQGPSPWLPLLDHLWWSLLVLVMSGLLLVALWRQRRHNRKIAQAWEAEGFGAADEEERDRDHPWARGDVEDGEDEEDDPPYYDGEDDED